MKHLFTDTDRDRIAEAVREAESRTSGEIVPVIVAESDSYGFVALRAAAIGLVVGALAFETIQWLYAGWGPGWLFADASLFGSMLVFAALMAFAGTRIPALRRLLIGRDALDRAVHSRAVHAFVEEEVFDTRDRTGILLLVSLFEHRVEVFGDSGINEKVSEDDWTDVVADIIKGVHAGKPADGLINAIERCGELLERAGVERRDDDENELSDRLRIK